MAPRTIFGRLENGDTMSSLLCWWWCQNEVKVVWIFGVLIVHCRAWW